MFSRLFTRAIPRAFAASGYAKRAFTTAATGFVKPSVSKKLVLGATLATTAIATTGLVACADKTPLVGVPGTKFERTFIAIKPDGVNRGLVGEIICRFERKGFKLVGIKILHPTKAQAEEHYADLSTKPFFAGLCNYFSSGAVVAMVWEGKGVVKTGRTLIGATNPAESTPGTIRGDLCIEVGRNIIHGSDSTDSAKAEITLWFKDSEVAEYQGNQTWVYEK
ncbi:hypothetical protein CYY_002531 [Polysphondylium violaceum]|uniref:nucleoside-diphosphate kinase n=1 Tax=Polysphondylium violaceum TaxID=133409 RepID=A0A8J4PXZ2_9MYCE|nr:hypothetical protein CYY_002531 [Polysphondylium violaceum]